VCACVGCLVLCVADFKIVSRYACHGTLQVLRDQEILDNPRNQADSHKRHDPMTLHRLVPWGFERLLTCFSKSSGSSPLTAFAHQCPQGEGVLVGGQGALGELHVWQSQPKKKHGITWHQEGVLCCTWADGDNRHNYCQASVRAHVATLTNHPHHCSRWCH